MDEPKAEVSFYPEESMVIEVLIRLPLAKQPARFGYKVPPVIYNDVFTPLPRDREVPWEIQSRLNAVNKQREREQHAAYLARFLADKILEAVESLDPKDGRYPRNHIYDESGK